MSMEGFTPRAEKIPQTNDGADKIKIEDLDFTNLDFTVGETSEDIASNEAFVLETAAKLIEENPTMPFEEFSYDDQEILTKAKEIINKKREKNSLQ